MAQSNQNESTYLVLLSLESEQKYGLEIIESISKLTGGAYIMKKPTLYSALTRLEKKGLVSSTYWGDSDFGGKRHYYALTDSGRSELERMKPIFADYDFSKDSIEISDETAEAETEKPVILQQENLFNIAAQKEPEPQTSQDEDEDEILENQLDLFSLGSQNAQNSGYSEDEPMFKIEADEPFEVQPQNSNFESETADVFQSAPSAARESRFEELLRQKMEESKTENQAQQSDDSRFLSDDEHLETPSSQVAEPLTAEEAQQNKKIFDSSAEFRKLSRKKSFSENQIEMAVEYETEDDLNAARQRRESLKESLLSARQNHYAPQAETSQNNVDANNFASNTSSPSPQNTQNSQNFSSQNTQNLDSQNFQSSNSQGFQSSNSQSFQTAQNTQISQPFQASSVTSKPSDAFSTRNLMTSQTPQPEPEEERKDDAVFITSRLEQHEIPIQRKIAPTNLDVDIDDSNMPAPNRNVSIEPTYKDMMSKLFERKKEKELESAARPAKVAQVTDEQVENFADYASLKKYYSQHDIEFREHTKGSAEIAHNTTFLTFLSSTILLLLSGITSAILFWILSASGNLNQSTNCLFYVAPILLLALSIVMLVRWRLFPTKKVPPTLSALSSWAIFVFGAVIVLIFNLILGMTSQNLGTFLTSLLIPCVTLLLIFPVNYHLTKHLFDKYGK